MQGQERTGQVAVEIIASGPVWTVVLSRPGHRNAVDAATARLLHEAVLKFEADPSARVLVLWGAGGTFCAGADLKAIAAGDMNPLEPVPEDRREAALSLGPMGPTRLMTRKPTIAAIAGHAVAGGLELALWCDLRVAEADSVLGVFCRRFGVPLIDGGTVRLPRLIGLSRALDLILTGRAVSADEALSMGLVNRVVPVGHAREAAEALAHELAALPFECLLSDRRSTYEGLELDYRDALANELAHGLGTLASGESERGARRFAGGAGRHGERADG